MLIKSLQLCNFRQYKGEQQPIIFSVEPDKNVTVILGINTSGKTTLIQAFLWCLYDECSFKPAGLLNAEVEESMNAYERRKVYVEIVLIHEDKEFVIHREMNFQMTDKYVLKPDGSVLRIQYKEDNGEYQPIPAVDRKDTIEKILPKALADYFFFDGERIKDINNRGDVVAAVRGLMGIDIIGSARDRLDPKSTASVTYKLEKELDLGSDSKANALKAALEKALLKRESLVERRNTAKDEVAFFTRRKAELAAQLRELDDAKKLQVQRDGVERDLRIAEGNVTTNERRIRDDFSKGAVRFFAQPLINRALSVMANSSQDGEGIPDMRQAAIDYILERNRCLCGCDLEENVGARKRIQHERSLLPPENIGTTIRDMRTTLEQYLIDAGEYGRTIRDNNIAYGTNLNYIDEKQKELETISDSINESGGADVIRVEADYRSNDRLLSEKTADYERLIADIGETDGEIKRLEQDKDRLVSSTTKNKRIQRCVAYARLVFNWFDKEYQKKEKEVKEQLLESVNRIFEQMYHGQRSVTINDKYQITLLTQLESSQKATGESPGLEAVKNFSFITGLVDLARHKVRGDEPTDEIDMEIAKSTEPYPLVMDAPFSNADEVHISNISRIVPTIAEQVILVVMRKDWEYAKEAIGERLGKAYLIEKVNNSDSNSVIRGGEADV